MDSARDQTCQKHKVSEQAAKNFNFKYQFIKLNLYFILLDTKIIRELGQDIRVHSVALTPEYKFSDKYSNIKNLLSNSKIFDTTRDVLRAVTREASPEGIIAEIDIPKVLDENEVILDDERVLFLFRISDPGNLGTLMRTALAFDWKRIVLVDDCVDPFNPECIRSSMGSALKLKIHRIGSNLLGSFIERNNIIAFIADSSAETHDFKHQIDTKTGLILGSEANGFSGFPPELMNNLKTISVKMYKDAESLNIAVCGGILMNKINCN